MYANKGQRSRPGSGDGNAPTPGGSFLPAGGPLGIGQSVVDQSAWVDPIHPLAVDDADLGTPFITPGAAIAALDAVLADAGGGTVLFAPGRYTIAPLVLPARRFWTLVPVGGFVQFDDVTLLMDGGFGGVAIGGNGFGHPLSALGLAQAGARMAELIVLDTGGGGGAATVKLAGVRMSGPIDATGHTGTSVINLTDCLLNSIDAPLASLTMDNCELDAAVAVSVDLYQSIKDCLFRGSITFTSGFGADQDVGFHSCTFADGPFAITSPDDIFMDEASLGRFQSDLWTFAGGAVLARLGNTTRTLWFPVVPDAVVGVGDYPTLDLPNDNATEASVGFYLPLDYPDPGQSIVNHLIRLVAVATADAGAAGASPLTFTVTTMAAALGEGVATHVDGPSALAGVATGAVGTWFDINVTTRIPDARAGDFVSVKLLSPVANGGTVGIAGVRLTYRPQ